MMEDLHAEVVLVYLKHQRHTVGAALLVMPVTVWPLVPRSGTLGVPKEGGIVPTPLTVVLLCVLSVLGWLERLEWLGTGDTPPPVIVFS